jgi:hypothetical protein
LKEKMCEPKEDEVTERRVELHNEELHNLYSPAYFVKVFISSMMMYRTCSTHGKVINT